MTLAEIVPQPHPQAHAGCEPGDVYEVGEVFAAESSSEPAASASDEETYAAFARTDVLAAFDVLVHEINDATCILEGELMDAMDGNSPDRSDFVQRSQALSKAMYSVYHLKRAMETMDREVAANEATRGQLNAKFYQDQMDEIDWYEAKMWGRDDPEWHEYLAQRSQPEQSEMPAV